ncbi:hypothetical protein SAMN05216199_0380 [Pedococcus cremeus]|uniref:Lipoprotein n=2 Tax=Pedococcus cremeus TaxID=587636 RepID=A0A1H9XTG0_9MICO|nr:hypothetical protein SAMN05216199_0380 [Pedococcus cremeus]
MTSQKSPRVTAHVLLAAAAAASLALTACGGGSAQSGSPVTVTVTPTVTASPKQSSGKAKTSEPAKPTSDVVGRTYDFGTVTDLKDVGGTPVLVLDRWTWKGLDDAKLARDGVPLSPFKGRPFTNQNDKLVYRIPVTADARVLYHHCVKEGEPQQTRSATVKEMAALRKGEDLVLVRLDDQGRAVAVDNLPGCPS